LILDRAVALARRQFQGIPVQNGNVTADVADDAGFLKDTGCYRHTGATHSQHAGEVFVRQGKLIAVSAVVRHQKPARKPFINPVHGVAGGTLGDLEQEGHDVAVQASGQGWALADSLAEGCDRHAPSGAGDLDHAFLGHAVGAKEDVNANHALPPDHTNLYGAATLQKSQH